MPRDFAATMGYQPQMIDAMVVNPTGSCSSPLPLPTAFDTACKAHDFGYDMIRYAAATGNAVDPQWRRTVDAQLGRRMHQACEGHVLCHGAASLATVALTVNSWRQRYGAPADEPFLPLALGGVAAIAAISALSIIDTRRRPSPRSAYDVAGAGAAG